MLKVTVPSKELFNDSTQEFINIKEQTLTLEHSLISVYKWESKWKRPFLSKTPMSIEETIDYIRCMTLTQNVDPNVYYAINDKIIKMVSEYIEDPMTATTFRNDLKTKGTSEIITAELIYYWMIALNIPFECQKWHLNKLLTLIKVCDIKNSPSKKMSKKDIYSRNKELNEARRKALKSSG